METLGLAPEAQLVIMKVFDMDGMCYFDYLIAAMEDAIALGVDCANLSLGSACGPHYYEGMTEVYDAARRRASTWCGRRQRRLHRLPESLGRGPGGIQLRLHRHPGHARHL